MADFVFNIVKGKWAYYAGLPAANDALIIVPLEATGLEADATLKDYDNLSLLLAGSSNEQITIGRLTATGVVVTVDDTADATSGDIADVTWPSATGNPLGALLVCYDPDTTTGDDTTIIPLTKHDFVVTPNGNDITGQVNVAGFAKAS